MTEPAGDEGHLLDSPLAGPAAVRGGVVRVASYFGSVLLSVLSAALLFRHLGVDDGGRYVTVIALLSIVAAFTDLGLTTIGMRELAAAPGAPREAFLRNLLGLRIGMSAVGMAAAVGFALLVGYEPAMVAGAALGGFGVLLVAVQSTLGVGLMAELRFGWMAALELLRQAIAVAGIVALVVVGASLLPFFAVSIPAAFVALVITAWLVRGAVPLRPSLDPRRGWRLLVEVIPVAAATAVTAIYFRVSIIVLSVIASERDTGYFGASYRVVEVLVLVPSLIVGAAFPIFARTAHGDTERFAYGLDRVFVVCILAGAWMAVVLAVGAPFAIEVVAGPEFAPSADVLRIQGVALAASFPTAVFFYGLLSLHRHREILLLSGSALVLNGVLVAILSSSHGAQGAAVGTVIAEFVLVIGGGVTLSRAAPSWKPSLGVLPRAAVAAALAAAPAAIPGMPSVVLAVLATIIFAGTVIVMKAVPAEVMHALRRRPPG